MLPKDLFEPLTRTAWGRVVTIDNDLRRIRVLLSGTYECDDASISAECDLSDFAEELKVGDFVEVVLGEPPGNSAVLTAELSNIRGLELIRSAISHDLTGKSRLKAYSKCIRGWRLHRRKANVLVQKDRQSGEIGDGEAFAPTLDDAAIAITGVNRYTRQISFDHPYLLELVEGIPIGTRLHATVSGFQAQGLHLAVQYEGEVLEGRVRSSEISWDEQRTVEHDYALGDAVEAIVLSKHANGRLALSIKRAMPTPWDTHSANLSFGMTVKGRIRNIVDYGVFVEIVPGLDGLLHISDMIPSAEVRDPHSRFVIGQMIEVAVKWIDLEQRKIGLSMALQGMPQDD